MSAYLLKSSIDLSGLDASQEVDTTTLHAIMRDCNRMRRDDRYTDEQKDQLKVVVDKIDAAIDKLMSAYFIHGLSEIAAANAEIKKAKKYTAEAIQNVNSTAEALEQISILLAAVDKTIDLLT